MNYQIIEEGQFKYLESGKSKDKVLLLLHGLFGSLSNFDGLVEYFSKKMNVVVPVLPIFDLPLRKATLLGLLKYVVDFVEERGYKQINVLGNSLGGHIALLYALEKPEKVASIILTGSSGLFESAMGSTFPKRSNYEYIESVTKKTFYNPDVATKKLVDDIFGIVNDRNKAIRIISTAKSAIRHNLENKLSAIQAPTLLVWGKQDEVTPPFVAEKFNELIDNSELEFVDKCGHAPMMEHPHLFNEILNTFLEKI
jgi:pimeloyl-ACP methyl ester carboxylesterase